MSLRLASEADCQFFRFWHDDRAYEGINCQGELFVQCQTFPLHCQDKAYDIGLQLSENDSNVLIVLSPQGYLVGTDLQSPVWQGRSRVSGKLVCA